MTLAQSQQQAAIQVTISDDRMSASLWIDPQALPSGAEVADILQRAHELGLGNPDALAQRLAELADADGRVSTASPVVIAEGTRPTDDCPARIERLVEPSTSDASAHHNFYDSHILTAQPGQTIARFIPAVDGQDGVDVLGHPVHRKHAATEPVTIGAGVELCADGQTIKATNAGQINIHGCRIWIDTVLEIKNNVDFSTGNIDFAGEVHIHGSVMDLFKVKSSASIRVTGAIEAAEVTAGHDLHVAGGIVCKDKGSCTAKSDITAKFISNARIIAGNNVTAKAEIANCRIVCGGKLTVEQGPLLASHVTATSGVHCRTLGSPAQAKTIIEAGIDEHLRQISASQMPQIVAQQAKAQKVKETVEPLLKNQKNLTPQQKEKATELLYEANEVETKTRELIGQIKKTYDAVQTRSKAEVVVDHMLYPGVTIRFPGLETTITMTLQGPLRITPKQIDGERKIVAIDPQTGSLQALDTRSFKDESLDSLERSIRSL